LTLGIVYPTMLFNRHLSVFLRKDYARLIKIDWWRYCRNWFMDVIFCSIFKY